MLNQQERSDALRYAYNGATFMFIPSEQLLNMIIADAPETKDINKTLRIILLNKKPIRMEVETIVKYCVGTLDINNTWLLDHGDVKVVPHQFKKIEITKAQAES